MCVRLVCSRSARSGARSHRSTSGLSTRRTKGAGGRRRKGKSKPSNESKRGAAAKVVHGQHRLVIQHRANVRRQAAKNKVCACVVVFGRGRGGGLRAVTAVVTRVLLVLIVHPHLYARTHAGRCARAIARSKPSFQRTRQGGWCHSRHDAAPEV